MVGDSSSGLWHCLQPRSQCWEKLTVPWKRLQQGAEELQLELQDLKEGDVSLLGTPVFWLGEKWGRAGAIQPLSPACVCWR